MLKTVLTELLANEELLVATLVATGHIDTNATPERLESVLAEMRKDLADAGISAPAAPADPAKA